MILFILLAHFFRSEVLESEEAFKASEEAQKYANEKLSAWVEMPQEPSTEEEKLSYDYQEQLKPDFNTTYHGFDERVITNQEDESEKIQRHPSSVRVVWRDEDGIRDFSVKPGDASKEGLYIRKRKFADERVRLDFRDVTLANNMHHCCKTCQKYGNECSCRAGFPFDVQLEDPFDPSYTGESKMRVRMGNKKRLRVTVEPPRNNANMNRHASMPAIASTWRGNIDQTCAIVSLN